MARDFSVNIKTKLDTSGIASDLNALKSKLGELKIKVTLDMPDMGSDMSAKGAEAASKFTEAFKQSMQSKIDFKIDTGDFQSKIDSVKAKFDSLSGTFDTIRSEMAEMGSVLGSSFGDSTKMVDNLEQTLQSAKSNIEQLVEAFNTLSSNASVEEKAQAFQQFNNLLPTIRSQLSLVSQEENNYAAACREAAQAQIALSNSDTLSNKIQTWMEQNTDAAKKYADELNRIQSSLRGNTDPTVVRQANADFNRIVSMAGTASSQTSDFTAQLGRALMMSAGIGSVYQIVNKTIQALKEMVSVAVEVESAMAQLQIVTGASTGELSSYYSNIAKTAKEIGGSVPDLIEATTTYARLGYSLDESSALAKYTSMLQNVGDIDVHTAENAVTAITKAFDIDVSDIEGVLDKMVLVGNNFPISVSELAEGINNAGSMLAASGNSFEETIAMLAAANATVQDVSKSSTGLRTIAARIRNTKTELDDLGEAMTTAKYEELVKALTDYNVALTDSDGSFRSTYDILKDLSVVWNDLSSSQQAALAQTIAGTRQQNVFYSLMEEFSLATDAMDQMQFSAGALSSAYDVYMGTTEAHVNRLKAAWTEFSTSVVNTDLAKFFVDLGTSALEGLTGIAKLFSVESVDERIASTASQLSELYTQINRTANSYQTLESSMDHVIPRITELSQGVNKYGENITLSDSEYQEFLSLNNQLGRMFPDLVAGYDDGGNALLGLNYNASNLAETLQHLVDVERELANTDIASNLSDVVGLTQQQAQNFQDKIDEYIKYENGLDYLMGRIADSEKTDYINPNQSIGTSYGYQTDRISVGHISSYAKQQIEAAGINVGEYGIIDLNNLNTEQKETLNNILNEESGYASSKTDAATNYYKYKQEQLYNSLAQGYQAWVKTSDFYDDFTSFEQIVAQEYAGNLDYGNLIENYLSANPEATGAEISDFIQQTLYNGINDSVEHVNPYVKSFLDKTFDLKQKLRSGEITADQYAQGVSALIDAAFRQANTQGQADQLVDWLNLMGFGGSSWQEIIDNINSGVPVAQESFSAAKEKADQFLGSLSNVQKYMSGTTTGESISYDDYESLQEYSSALEYNNGALTLNAEKVQDLVQAKKEETLATLEAGKAQAEQSYLENAAEIERLNKQLKENNNLTDEERKEIENSITSKRKDNEELLKTINGFDIYAASVEEATNAYHNWLNAKSASQSGDMFDEALNAFEMIDSVFDKESELYGRVGRTDYQDAVDFLVPDSIDKTDEDAVQSYMDSISNMFEYDANGNRTGLNIENFLNQAVENGLAAFDSETGKYRLLGQQTLEEFAEGMNMSMGLVQAMFGDIAEFGDKYGTFDFGKQETYLDVQLRANVAADELREQLESIGSDLDVKLNFDDLALPEEKISAIRSELAELSDIRAQFDVQGIDTSAIDSVIDGLLAQLHQLEQPITAQIDISSLSGSVAEAIALFENLRTAMNNLQDADIKFGSDSIEFADAQAAVDEALEAINKSDAAVQVAATLELDTSSAESLMEGIGDLDLEVLAKVGIDSSNLQEQYQLIEQPDPVTIVFMVDDKDVNEWKPPNNLPNVDVQFVPHDENIQGWSAGPFYVDVIYNEVNKPSSTSQPVSTDNGSGTVRPRSDGGTAYASGEYFTSRGEKVLLGEKGREIVVDTKTGRWYTVGEAGPEFRYIPSGAIIFDHEQTEEILRGRNGSPSALSMANEIVNVGRSSAQTRGGSLPRPANGDLFSHTFGVAEGVSSFKPHGASMSYEQFSTAMLAMNSNLTADQIMAMAEQFGIQITDGAAGGSEKDWFDWIEIAIDRIERSIKKLKTIAESAFKTLSARMKASKGMISELNEELIVQTNAYNKYMEQANSVGLSEELKAKVRDGSIDITQYDEDTRKLIEDYKKWYENALDCADAIDDIHESLAKLYKDNFDKTQKDFENRLALITHATKTYQQGLNLMAAQGYFESTKYYSAMGDATKQQIRLLNKELEDLTKQFNEAMASGEIEKYSPAWYQMQQAINSVKEEIGEATIELQKFENAIRDLEWSYFDYERERVSQLITEADFLIDLLSSKNLYDDNGQLSEYGMATMGLHGQNYNVYMAQADAYGKELFEINKSLADDPYNKDLIARKEELIKLQQESILGAEREKQAMVSLVREGIQIELSALKELIDTYKQSLDNAKSLYDYQNKVNDKAAQIANIQKQLSAYSGDTSEEAQATIQRLQADLKNAQEDLERTEYEKYISDQKKLLDELYIEYETLLNKRLDDVDSLIGDMIEIVNQNGSSIGETIDGAAESVGYTITDEERLIWGGYFSSTDSILSTYGDGFSGQLTSINSVLGLIHGDVQNMVNNSDVQAQETLSQENIIGKMKANSLAWLSANDVDRDKLHRENQKMVDEYNYISGESWYYSNGSWFDSEGNQLYTIAEAIVDKMKENSAKWHTADEETRAKLEDENAKLGQRLGEILGKPVYRKNGKWYIDDDGTQKELYKVYRSGGLVDYTGLARVDGSPSKPELMLNAQDTANFLALRDTLRQLSTQPITSASRSYFGLQSISEIVDIGEMLSMLRTPVGNTGVSFGDFEINIPIENVQDYNDFVRQLRSDQQFESMILDMTLGRSLGKTSLSKYKYQW